MKYLNTQNDLVGWILILIGGYSFEQGNLIIWSIITLIALCFHVILSDDKMEKKNEEIMNKYEVKHFLSLADEEKIALKKGDIRNMLNDTNNATIEEIQEKGKDYMRNLDRCNQLMPNVRKRLNDFLLGLEEMKVKQ